MKPWKGFDVSHAPETNGTSALMFLMVWKLMEHSLRLPYRPLQLKNTGETKKKPDAIGFLCFRTAWTNSVLI